MLITETHEGGNVFSVGQTVNYVMTVTNLPATGSETDPNSIVVTDVIPVGMTNLTAQARDWNITLTSTTSPSTITATYVGTYPVTAGTNMPPIFMSGTLTDTAGPVFTNTASVAAPGDPNPSLNTSVDSIFVVPSYGSPTATVYASPTATVYGSPTATVYGSPTATVTSGSTPDLFIEKTHLGGDQFQVGDNATFVLLVGNSRVGSTISGPGTITVTDVIPVGIHHLKASGQGWQFVFSDDTGPAVLTATYNVVAPVAPGTLLPAIKVTGDLTNDAVPSITNTASVGIQGDTNAPDETATDTIFVKENQHQNDNNNNNNNNNDHNNNDHNNNNHNNNNNNNNQNNNNNNNQNNNNNNNSNNNHNYPSLPSTGSQPY
jgi:hypothetical protein